MENEEKNVYLHEKLTHELLSNIENKVWRVQSKIPTEKELGEMYGVSRATVRQALGILEKKGYVERRQGKGTFVAQPKIEQPLGKFYTFSDQIIQLGMVPSARIYELRQMSASPETARMFGLSGSERVYFGIRLRLADDTPIALEHFYLPERLFPSLTAQEIEKNGLYNTMRMKYGIDPDEAEETFEAIQLNRTEAELLQWEYKKPGIRLERRTTAEGVLVEVSNAVIRADRYKCRIRLTK